jgi:cellulose biosynthesis protein BcsQ
LGSSNHDKELILSERGAKLRAILMLTGMPGSGKTTIATLLGEALAPADLLFIDATADENLTHALAPNPPQLTLAQVFGSKEVELDSLNRNGRYLASGREAIDWTFSDLTVEVGEESDVLTVGPLLENLDGVELDKLRYGLNRLMDAYDYVVVDGLHPIILSLLPAEALRTLSVLTPEQFATWQPPSEDGTHLHTPYLLLNNYNGEIYPQALEAALSNQRIQLIGKLPRYSTPRECAHQMPIDFQNGLMRLNIPLFPV